jgi:hypothetical protein
MGASKRGGGNTFDPGLVLRVREDFYGTSPWTGVNATPGQLLEGLRNSQVNTPQLLNGTSGGTLAGGAQVDGRRILQGSSNGGAVAFRRGGNCTFPLSATYGNLGQFYGRNGNRRFRSYLFAVTMRLTAQAGGGRGECSLSDADNGITINAGARNGAGWVFDTAVFAGRLTPAYRQNGGALSTPIDTGVSMLNTWTSLGMRYVEGLVPRIEWLLNGAVARTVSGDVNMPVFAGGATLEPGWLPMYGWSQHVGSIMQMLEAVYEVREV